MALDRHMSIPRHQSCDGGWSHFSLWNQNGGCTDAVVGQLGWNLEGLAHQGLILRVSAERMASEGCEVESLVVAEPACHTDDVVCAVPVGHAQVWHRLAGQPRPWDKFLREKRPRATGASLCPCSLTAV
jgi:hypothetical protein